MSKKVISVIAFLGFIIMIPNVALALGDNFFSVSNPTTVKAVSVKEDDADRTRILQERRDEATRAAEEQRINAKNTLRSDQAKMMQNVTQGRLNAYLKVVSTMDQLLKKLQVRVDAAKAEGRDVSSAEVSLKDAQEKLAQSKLTLEQIQSEKDIAITKETFLKIHQEFLTVGKDLVAIRTSAVRVTSYVKAFGVGYKVSSPSAIEK